MLSRRSIMVACAGVLLALVVFMGGARTTFVAPGQHDVIAIDDVIRAERYYGRLDDHPHTYSFTLTESTTVSLRILVPDTKSAPVDKTGLLLESLPDDAGVREVKRLPAQSASWDQEYAWKTGDTYRTGPSYYDTLEPGTYLFEVSTPINRGQYVLEIGTAADGVGYVAALKDLSAIKDFFGKPWLALFQSPLTLVPLIAFSVTCSFAVGAVRRRWFRHE